MTENFLKEKIAQRRVIVFGREKEPASDFVWEKISERMKNFDLHDYERLDIDRRHDALLVENFFFYSLLLDRRQTPYIFVDGKYFGGFHEIRHNKKWPINS
ncbi:hypothetical protein SNEBB_000129 [Seison nebaliae]|nr:hypothetical protein SNEBB_000129 [Seison nebaliae]